MGIRSKAGTAPVAVIGTKAHNAIAYSEKARD